MSYAHHCLVINEKCFDYRAIEIGNKMCEKYKIHNECAYAFLERKNKCKMSIEKCLDCKFCELDGFCPIGCFIYCKIYGNKLLVTKCIKEA